MFGIQEVGRVWGEMAEFLTQLSRFFKLLAAKGPWKEAKGSKRNVFKSVAELVLGVG